MMTTPFEFPAWASVLFGQKPAPPRPDLATTDAPEIEPQVTTKRRAGRPPGKYGTYKPRKKEAAT